MRISNQSYDRSISNLLAQSSTFCLLLRVLLLVVRLGSVISVLGLHDVIIVNCNIKTFMRDNLLCFGCKVFINEIDYSTSSSLAVYSSLHICTDVCWGLAV